MGGEGVRTSGGGVGGHILGAVSANPGALGVQVEELNTLWAGAN